MSDEIYEINRADRAALLTGEEVTGHDPVTCPAHYAGDGKVECMDALASMMAGYDAAGAGCEAAWWAGCALKYLWRAPLKNGRQDWEKARQCLDYLLDMIGQE